MLLPEIYRQLIVFSVARLFLGCIWELTVFQLVVLCIDEDSRFLWISMRKLWRIAWIYHQKFCKGSIYEWRNYIGVIISFSNIKVFIDMIKRYA